MATKDQSAAPGEPDRQEPDPRESDRPAAGPLQPAGPPPLDFASAVRALLARRRTAAGRHPPPGQLREYERRLLATRSAEQMREHLSVCRRCCRLLLALAGLADVRRARPPLGRRPRRE